MKKFIQPFAKLLTVPAQREHAAFWPAVLAINHAVNKLPLILLRQQQQDDGHLICYSLRPSTLALQK